MVNVFPDFTKCSWDFHGDWLNRQTWCACVCACRKWGRSWDFSGLDHQRWWNRLIWTLSSTMKHGNSSIILSGFGGAKLIYACACYMYKYMRNRRHEYMVVYNNKLCIYICISISIYIYKVQYINKRNPSFQIDQILYLVKCFVFFGGDIPWVTLQCHQTWLEKSTDFRGLGTTARKTKAASAPVLLESWFESRICRWNPYTVKS